jgi:hypothetical protein
MNPVFLVEEDGDLAMTFNARDRLDGDPPQPVRRFCGFEVRHGRDP